MDLYAIDTTLVMVIGLTILIGSAISIACLIVLSILYPVAPAQLTRTITQRSWTGRQVTLLLAGFIGMMLLIAFIHPVVNHSESPAATLIPVLFFAGSQVLMLLLAARKREQSWGADYDMCWRQLRLLPVSLAVYLAAVPILGIITQVYYSVLENTFGIAVEVQDAVQLIAESRSWVKAGYILLAVGVAPLYEELVFRGVLFPYLLRRLGIGSALVIVSLVFALIHFHVPSMLPLFLLSVVLCLVYWRTGSLWTSIGVHALFNGMTVLLLLLA